MYTKSCIIRRENLHTIDLFLFGTFIIDYHKRAFSLPLVTVDLMRPLG